MSNIPELQSINFAVLWPVQHFKQMTSDSTWKELDIASLFIALVYHAIDKTPLLGDSSGLTRSGATNFLVGEIQAQLAPLVEQGKLDAMPAERDIKNFAKKFLNRVMRPETQHTKFSAQLYNAVHRRMEHLDYLLFRESEGPDGVAYITPTAINVNAILRMVGKDELTSDAGAKGAMLKWQIANGKLSDACKTIDEMYFRARVLLMELESAHRALERGDSDATSGIDCLGKTDEVIQSINGFLSFGPGLKESLRKRLEGNTFTISDADRPEFERVETGIGKTSAMFQHCLNELALLPDLKSAWQRRARNDMFTTLPWRMPDLSGRCMVATMNQMSQLLDGVNAVIANLRTDMIFDPSALLDLAKPLPPAKAAPQAKHIETECLHSATGRRPTDEELDRLNELKRANAADFEGKTLSEMAHTLASQAATDDMLIWFVLQMCDNWKKDEHGDWNSTGRQFVLRNSRGVELLTSDDIIYAPKNTETRNA